MTDYEKQMAQAIYSAKQAKIEDEILAKRYVNKYYDECIKVLKSDAKFLRDMVEGVRCTNKPIPIPINFAVKKTNTKLVEIKKPWWNLNRKKKYKTITENEYTYPSWYNEIEDYFQEDPKTLFGTIIIVEKRPYLRRTIEKRKRDLLKSLLIEKEDFPNASVDYYCGPIINLGNWEKP